MIFFLFQIDLIPETPDWDQPSPKSEHTSAISRNKQYTWKIKATYSAHFKIYAKQIEINSVFRIETELVAEIFSFG